MGILIIASLWGFGSFTGFNFGPVGNSITPVEHSYYLPAGSDSYLIVGGDKYQVASD